MRFPIVNFTFLPVFIAILSIILYFIIKIAIKNVIKELKKENSLDLKKTRGMKYKGIIYIIVILLVSMLLVRVYYSPFTGRNVETIVRNKEVKDFTKSTLDSNERVKKLNFYYLRQNFCADLIYDGDLSKNEIEALVEEFKKLINVETMKKIEKEYWNSMIPSSFELYIYINRKESEGVYDYLIKSNYNKTFRVDEDPENIDGYKTWFIKDNKHGERIIGGAGKRIETWTIPKDWTADWKKLYIISQLNFREEF